MKEVPFRVMCVNDETMFGGADPGCEWKIVTGGKYTVTKVIDWSHIYDDGIYFELDIQPGFGYAQEHFATLPDPSEEVAIEHEQEAIIYQR